MPSESTRAELRTALLDLGYRLAGVRTPEDAARTIASVAQDMLGWDAYSLDLYFAETETVQAIVSMDRVGSGDPVDVPHAYASGPAGGMTRKVLAEGAQLILRDAAAPATEGLTPFGAVSRPSASLMFVPVRHGERVAGILSIQSYTPRAYDPDDLAVLQTLADHCGSALERLRIEEALRSERKILEEQLRQAQKMEAVGQLAGGVAHDFNNLLTAIIGNTELLLRTIDLEDRRRLDVLEIHRAAHRAATLTRQLLAFSRKQVLQPRIVDLNGVVAELTAMLRRIIGEHVELRLQLEPGLGRVLADPNQLEQVITNLAVNARDAMPSGGTLTIRTATLDEAEVLPSSPESSPLLGPLVELSVSDNGVGMDERTQARLFEPFFTTKELGRGTGLGLATVYGIVRQSGGHIRVSTRLHHGSTFTIYLPMAEGTAEPEIEAEGWADIPRGTGTILVVEDEDAVRYLACRVLRGNGYRVLEAADPAAALRIVQAEAQPIDLLVTDIVMPGMSGPVLAERLVAARPDLKVLYITGYAEEAIERQGALPAGGALLEKPFTAQQLADSVRQALAIAET
jgi:signal transduction histidine kinase/ActR/RegA family two-component response regulator